jgi:hypothetical protein
MNTFERPRLVAMAVVDDDIATDAGRLRPRHRRGGRRRGDQEREGRVVETITIVNESQE